MKIRRFRPDDLADVIEFSKRAYGYEQEQKHLDDLRLLEECCTRGYEDEPAGMFVAEVDGKVVGSLFAFSNDADPDEGSLHWVGVDPDRRGEGIGKKLMAEAEGYLRSRGVKRVVLGTDRPGAMPFYVGQGYGMVNCTMMKRLPDPEPTSVRTQVQKIIEAIEAYAAFRFTHHNVDIVTRRITEVLQNPNPKVEDLIKIADDYVVYPQTPRRTEAARKRLEAILKE